MPPPFPNTCLKISLFTGALVIGATLYGCVFPGVYRLDVQQGNIVEADTLAQVTPGMTRNQVHFLLGYPVAVSTFDQQVETYVYTMQIEGGEIHRQVIDLNYDGDVLVSVDYDELLPPNLANPGRVYKIGEAPEKTIPDEDDAVPDTGSDIEPSVN